MENNHYLCSGETVSMLYGQWWQICIVKSVNESLIYNNNVLSLHR